VRFHANVKGLRRKELPELNDEFAQDLGDYRTMDELRDAVRKSLFAARQYEAQQEAKNKLIEKLVADNEFPVPEVFVENQDQDASGKAACAHWPPKGWTRAELQLDWKKVKETQRDKAVGEVKASLLLSRIAEREAIHATRDEVDKEVDRAARQQREAFAASTAASRRTARWGRLANHIQTEKTLSFLFEHAEKTGRISYPAAGCWMPAARPRHTKHQLSARPAAPSSATRNRFGPAGAPGKLAASSVRRRPPATNAKPETPGVARTLQRPAAVPGASGFQHRTLHDLAHCAGSDIAITPHVVP